MADELDYVPLPDRVKELVRKQWAASIKDASGKAIACEVTRCAGAGPAPPRRGLYRGACGRYTARHRRAKAAKIRVPTLRHGPPARRAGAPRPWADALFSALAHGAAWLTLALLAGIIVSLVIGAAPAIREYGLGVPLDRASGTRCRTATAAW